MNLEKQEFIRHRRKFLRNIIFLLVGVVVIVFTWLTVQSYHRLLGEDEIKQTKSLLTKINPQLKLEAINKLENMEEFSIDDIDRQLAEQALSLSIENQSEVSSSTKSASATASGEASL